MMLPLPNLANLNTLKIGIPLTPLQMESIAQHMPQLHTLHLLHSRQPPSACSALPRLSNLTSLALCLEYFALQTMELGSLSDCAKLRQLILIRAPSMSVVALMLRPTLGERLSQLELVECAATISFINNGAVVWGRSFAAMRLLQILTLRACADTGSVCLAAGGHSPALTTIVLIPKDTQLLDAADSMYSVPTVKQVREALQLRQALPSDHTAPFCIQLQFFRRCREHNITELGSARWTMEVDGWRELETTTLHQQCRFQLMLDVSPSS